MVSNFGVESLLCPRKVTCDRCGINKLLKLKESKSIRNIFDLAVVFNV